MNFVFDCHQDPQKLHVGCEAPRAYFIPYQSEAAALADNRGASDFFTSLCGDWDFRFYPSLNDLEDFTLPNYPRNGMRYQSFFAQLRSVAGAFGGTCCKGWMACEL